MNFGPGARREYDSGSNEEIERSVGEIAVHDGDRISAAGNGLHRQKVLDVLAREIAIGLDLLDVRDHAAGDPARDVLFGKVRDLDARQRRLLGRRARCAGSSVIASSAIQSSWSRRPCWTMYSLWG